MKNIYTSIDIGSDTIKVVVLELFKNKLNLLAASSYKSKGIKKGLITDITEAANSLSNAISEVEMMLGVKINKIVASVPSYFAEFNLSKAEIQIESEEQIVTSTDIISSLQASIKGKMAVNAELVTIMPIDFTIDGMEEVKDPKGMTAKKLGVRDIVVTAPKKNIYSVVSLIESIGLEVVDISLNGIGDAFAFKTKENSEQIGAIINIGYEKTEVSIYNRGIIVKNSILGYGGKNIDSDISYMYKISLDQANKLKEKFALAHKHHASANDFYEVRSKSGEMIKVNQYEISEVVMSRLEEILTLAQNEINTLTNKSMHYIIITGGTSHIANFSKLAEEVLGKNTTVGEIKVIGARNNKYSSAIGNVVYFINKLKLKGKNYSMFSQADQEYISNTKKGIINVAHDSMLGRVFGFFTSE